MWPQNRATRKEPINKTVLILILLVTGLPSLRLFAQLSQPPGGYRAFIWSGETDATYDASGNQTSGLAINAFFDRKGQLSRTVSCYFSQFFGVEFRYYDTNVFIQTNSPFSYVSIDDSINLSNGYPFLIEHSVTTGTNFDNSFREVTVRTSTTGDGQSSETITTGTVESSADFYRSFSEVRDTNENLLSWSLNSWTNDPVHFQEYYLYELGGSNETDPSLLQENTNTFDALGHVIVSTTHLEFDGYSASSVTSNSYVIDEKGRVLSVTGQNDSGADGTIDSVTVTTFGYDKFGNVARQDVKQFAVEGTLEGENVTSFVSDNFGNLLSSETRMLDSNGAVLDRNTTQIVYLPRGQVFGRGSAAQRFLDRARGDGRH